VEQERLFDAYAGSNTANRDAGRDLIHAVTANNHTLKDLDTLLGTFFDELVHADSITGLQLGQGGLAIVLFELANSFHNLGTLAYLSEPGKRL
jgi:hypothetical protein